MALLSSDFTDEKGRIARHPRYYARDDVILTKPGRQARVDDLDRNILAQLSGDARMSVAVLARRLRVARSTVQARLERLEGSGAIVLLGIEPRAQAAVLSRLKVIAQVERVHTTSGRVDLLVQLAAASTTELDMLLDRIGAIDGVRSSESLIHLSTKLDRAV
jgi:DNA-binding Lrp family transcriptional regulator